MSVGYNPAMILAGRNLNDGMGAYVAGILVDKMKSRNIPIKGSKVLILGYTFKENCSDIRNTKVIDIVRELKNFMCEVAIHDPYVSNSLADDEFQNLVNIESSKLDYDAIIIAVAHQEFKNMGIEKIRSFGKDGALIYDLKWIFKEADTDLRL